MHFLQDVEMPHKVYFQSPLCWCHNECHHKEGAVHCVIFCCSCMSHLLRGDLNA